MRKQALFIVGCCMCCWVNAQVMPARYAPKMAPRLQTEQAWLPVAHRTAFLLQCTDTALLQRLAAEHKDSLHIQYAYGNVFSVSAFPQWVRRHLLPLPSLSFIDANERQAKEEVALNDGFDYTTDYVNKAHSDYPTLNGGNTVVSIKENKPDTADIDFSGRFISTPLSSPTLSSHATIMGTIIAGGGNSFYTARGVAPAAGICSSSFAVLLPDSDAAYRRYQVTVQNHSYGTGIENYYGADAAAYDASVVNNPSLLHVFSSGNSGNGTAGSGAYKGIAGWANLTGSFKMSKNSIAVGSVDSFSAVPLLSSKGPAYDGRVKPDLVAFGEDGSSGAAALVSGTALLLQQAYKAQSGGTGPDAALVKAVLLNSAGETGNKGIDFSSGFGRLDTWRAVNEMQAARFFSGTLTQGQSQSFSISLPANAQNLKVLLCWTDKPALANAATALVNDLDLTLTHMASSQSWQPWVLNSMADKDSLSLLPVRKRDSLNNAEQVTVDAPPAGNYTITVNGYAIAAGAQKFVVVYQWDTTGSFAWMYPAKNDNLLPGQANILRWQSNYTVSGLAEYRLAGSSSWLPVQTVPSPSTQYLSWRTPDTSAVALLRMTIAGQQYVSDSFTLSPRPITGVGLNCPDSFLLYWNKNPAATGYILYRLGAQYLAPLQTLTDTSVLLPASTATSSWYAVSVLLPFHAAGLRSFAFDYTKQGVDCYIKSFTADLAGTAAVLQLALGSSYRVSNTSIEKLVAGGYRLLKSFGAPAGLQYTTSDSALARGENSYRVKIQLNNGQVIYSDKETVYYTGNSPYLVYPNPVAQQQSIHVVATGLNNPVFRLFNAAGMLIMQKTLHNLVEEIPAGAWAKGFYFYLINDGKNDVRGKIIVQ